MYLHALNEHEEASTMILTEFVMIELTRTAENRPSNAACVSALGGDFAKWNMVMAMLHTTQ